VCDQFTWLEAVMAKGAQEVADFASSAAFWLPFLLQQSSRVCYFSDGGRVVVVPCCVVSIE
jgi:hypothetical protein